MKSNNILLADPAFDPATAPACKLLVKIGLDSLSYAIINVENKKVQAVFDEQECEDGTQKLAQCLKSDSYLTLPYQEIKVAFLTDNTISIPNTLYNEDDLDVHTQFFTSASSGNLYKQHHDFHGFTTIFSISSAAELFYDSGIKKFQQGAALLKLTEKIEGTILLLDFTVGAFNALFMRDQQVVLQQYYETENTDEFNYYLILMINQLQINVKTTAVQIMGIIHEGDAKYTCLNKYFASIHFLAIESELNLDVLEDMPAHYYTTLLALDQCV